MAPTSTHTRVRYHHQIAAGTAVLLTIANIITQDTDISPSYLHQESNGRIPDFINEGTYGTLFRYTARIFSNPNFGAGEQEPLVPIPSRQEIKVRFRRSSALTYVPVEDENGFIST